MSGKVSLRVRTEGEGPLGEPRADDDAYSNYSGTVYSGTGSVRSVSEPPSPARRSGREVGVSGGSGGSGEVWSPGRLGSRGSGGRFFGGAGSSISRTFEAAGRAEEEEVADCVCRVSIPGEESAFGVLVRFDGEDCLLTAFEVMDDTAIASKARCTFRFSAAKTARKVVRLMPDRLFRADKALGYTLCGCNQKDVKKAGLRSANLPPWDLEMVAADSEVVLIAGDPRKRSRRRTVHEVLKVTGPFVWYDAAVADDKYVPGEGAPVLRGVGQFVGIHIGYDERQDYDRCVQLNTVVTHLELPNIIDILKKHPDESMLQSRGALAISMLTFNSHTARKDVVSDGAVEVVLAALQHHMSEIAVVENACGALSNIAAGEHPDCQNVMLKAGVLRSLRNAIDSHGASERVAEGAFRTLANLAVGPDSSKAAILEAGLIPLVVATMQKHPRNASIQEAACRTLASVSFGSTKRKDAIVDEGGPACITDAMETHLSVVSVQVAGCLALLDLAAGGGKRASAVHEAKAIERVVAAMKQHPRHIKIQEYGCIGLWNMAGGSKERRKKVVAEGARDLARELATNDLFKGQTGVVTASQDLCKRLDGEDKCTIM